jgi:hypothetical protein
MRVPAHKAGKVAKLYDCRCSVCDKVDEYFATEEEIDSGVVRCGCGGQLHRLISPVGLDREAAAAWRR